MFQHEMKYEFSIQHRALACHGHFRFTMKRKINDPSRQQHLIIMSDIQGTSNNNKKKTHRLRENKSVVAIDLTGIII